MDEYDRALKKENAQHDLKDHNEDLVDDIRTFIKKNKQLIHFDLTSTNLTEYMIWKIGSALSKAKSVVSIHFSNNQCISPALKQNLFKRISCKNLKPERRIGLDIGLSDKVITNNPELPSQPISVSRMSALANKEKFMLENMQIRKIKKTSFQTEDELDSMDQNKFILERQIGHKLDLPGYGQWRLLTRDYHQCWVCSKQNYVLFFWSKKHGLEDDEIIERQEDNLIQQIEDVNNNFKDAVIKGPVFIGQMTDWEP